MTDLVEARTANLNDIPHILSIEERVWPVGLRANHDMLRSRMLTFPQGQVVATFRDRICGFLSTQICDFDIRNPARSWYQATDSGHIRRTHNPNGNVLFGVNLSALPVREANVVDALLLAAGELIVRFNLEGAALGARLARYYRFAGSMTADEYARAVTGRGRPIDPELSLYCRYGLKLVMVLPEYIDDAESLNNGVLMFWRNPLHREAGPVTTFSYIDQVYDPAFREAVPRWILLLPGAGCEWAKKSGCLMCGFGKSIAEFWEGRHPTSREIGIIYRLGRRLVQSERPRTLTIYNGGSFLNDREIPLDVQTAILDDVATHESISGITVETRPEFVTSERLSLYMSRLDGKRLCLGIGLESASDLIRQRCINKGFDRVTYERAVKTARDAGAEVLTYVFLKPPYLTEKESIVDAINSVRYAFEVGSHSVAIEAAFVQEGTFLHGLFQKGRFRPPWLWSIAEVLKACAHLGPVLAGGFRDEPPPIAVPANCGECDRDVLEAFEEYNRTLDVSLLGRLRCHCQREWNAALLQEQDHLSADIFTAGAATEIDDASERLCEADI